MQQINGEIDKYLKNKWKNNIFKVVSKPMLFQLIGLIALFVPLVILSSHIKL